MTSRALSYISRYRWPIGLAGVIVTFVSINALFIGVAVRDYDALAPQDDYYDRAVRHDELRASVMRAEQAGLEADITVADAPVPTMPRRVDVAVRDRFGGPVTGLAGTLTAIRPADVRLRNAGELVAVPGHDGLYRLLLKVPVSGLWEFELSARKGQDDYVMVVRQDVSI
ncbi:MAG: FixH family protein [Polyangiaceae bacterium]|jgi:hypothetical protein|nr:FixH family protein [Polyangiaceae bacterium]